MKKKKTYKTKLTHTTLNEPVFAYEKNRIVVFNSFEEENEYVAKERANVPYNKRLINIEILRKIVFNNFLLPNGSWPPIASVFKIMPPYTNDISK